MSRTLWLIFFALFLSGCASVSQQEVDHFFADLDETNLYIRGTFNWWGAQEAFRFIQIDSDNWATDIFLEDDGIVYDFKLSNANWTPHQTCGSKEAKVKLTTQTPVMLYCDTSSHNVQYKPTSGNGIYRFLLTKKADNYQLSAFKR